MPQPKQEQRREPTKPTKKKSPTPTGQKADSAARMEAFCLAYHRKPDGTQAAIDAGYAPSSAAACASRLLRSNKVRARLQELAAAAASAAIADGKERREYLTKVLRDHVRDVATGGKELEYIHTPVPVAERTRAAIELAKMDGDYAPVKLSVQVTEYSRDWLKRALGVIAKYVTPEELREIAREIPRFDP